jgi:transcriptional regulator with XRE-family HTH domain
MKFTYTKQRGRPMEIGEQLKNLRVQKNLTQEELGERTDLSKGYISQLEHDSSSPSMETFFSILEVLGVTPEEFFKAEKETQQKVLYQASDRTAFDDEEHGYHLEWLVPESNEFQMEPIVLTFEKNGEYKQFEPSLSETFIYVLEGRICLSLGNKQYQAKKGETLYYTAEEPHQLKNVGRGKSRVVVVATESYL